MSGTRRFTRVAGRPRRIVLVSRLLCCLTLAALPLSTAAQAPTDVEVKAAYIYHFGRFVTWPAASEGDTFRICVVGRDPLGRAIETTVAGERLSGRPIEVRSLDATREASGCHILVLGRGEDRQLADRLAELGKRPILTVGDLPEFCARGGMIEFVAEQNRVRFLVDRARAEAAGLVLSSELLRVARLYTRPGGGAGEPR